MPSITNNHNSYECDIKMSVYNKLVSALWHLGIAGAFRLSGFHLAPSLTQDVSFYFVLPFLESLPWQRLVQFPVVGKLFLFLYRVRTSGLPSPLCHSLLWQHYSGVFSLLCFLCIEGLQAWQAMFAEAEIASCTFPHFLFQRLK